jgi:hypothetical protein
VALVQTGALLAGTQRDDSGVSDWLHGLFSCVCVHNKSLAEPNLTFIYVFTLLINYLFVYLPIYLFILLIIHLYLISVFINPFQ